MTKPASPWWPRPCQASVLKPGSLGAFSPETVCTRPGFCQFLYPARSAEMDRRVLKHPVKPTKRETTAVLKAITLSQIPTSLPPPCARVCLRTSLQATFLLFNLVISPGFWALSQTAETQICMSVLTAGNTNLLGHDEEKGNVLLCFTACHATSACRRWTDSLPAQTNRNSWYQQSHWLPKGTMESACFQLSADRGWSVLWGHPCGFSDGTEASSGTQHRQILTREHHKDLVLAGCCQGILTPHSLPRKVPADLSPSHLTKLPGISVGMPGGCWPPASSSRWDMLRTAALVSGAPNQFQQLQPSGSPEAHQFPPPRRQHRSTKQPHPNSAPIDRYPHACIFSSSAT